jgi:hypothetical protein
MNRPGFFKDVTPPSFFEFAKSEYCRDAFLCWLLEWADPSHGKFDKRLHMVGIMLVKELLKQCGIEPPLELKKTTIPSLKRINNRERIDILAMVNDDIAILIEDVLPT